MLTSHAYVALAVCKYNPDPWTCPRFPQSKLALLLGGHRNASCRGMGYVSVLYMQMLRMYYRALYVAAEQGAGETYRPDNSREKLSKTKTQTNQEKWSRKA